MSSNSKPTVLVIGGCGFLGSHIVEELATNLYYDIVTISRNPNQTRHAKYFACDVTDHDAVAKLIDKVKPRIIIHSATPHYLATRDVQLKDYEATKNLLKVAKRSNSVKGLIYTASSSALANSTGLNGSPLREEEAVLNTLQSGPSHYARIKGASTSLVLDSNTRRRIHLKWTDEADENFNDMLLTTVLCLPGIYGPRDHNKTDAMLNMLTAIQFGPNTTLHEFVYVENAADAHVRATEVLLSTDTKSKSNILRIDGEMFFITDGKPIRFWDLVRKLKVENRETEATNFSKVFVIPGWFMMMIALVNEWLFWIFTLGGQVPHLNSHMVPAILSSSNFDITKARKMLDYHPNVDVDEGVRRYVEWFREQAY